MEKTYNRAGIKSDLESLCTYKNEINGWNYYLKKYATKLGSLPKTSSTSISIDDLKYIGLFKKEKKQVVKIYLKLMESDDFINFVINDLGYEFVQSIVWSSEPVDWFYLESIFDIKMFERRHYERILKKEYAIFNDNSYYLPPEVKLPTYIHQRFQSFFKPPKDYLPSPVPEGKLSHVDNFVFNNEKQIFDLISKLFYLSKNDFIKLSTTGKILKSSINKIHKANQINEIFPRQHHEATDNFLLKSLLALINDLDKNINSNDVLGILKNILFNIKLDDYSIYSVIMEIYKGNPNGKHHPTSYRGFFSAIKLLSEPNKWYTSEGLMRHLHYRKQVLDPIGLYMGTALKLKFQNDKGFVEINSEDKQITVLMPYLNGMIYTLASLGLIEVSSNFDDVYLSFQKFHQVETVQIPYYALEYFRLTKLGRHIFELDKEYEVPETNFKETEVIPDIQTLTLSLSKEDDLIYSHLVNFAKPMGTKLFLVTEKSFLKKVTTKDQMESNIARLKQLITKPLPPNWFEFLKQLEQKFNPLIKVKDRFSLYKIPDNNPALFNLLMTDIKLKSLYTKVDNKQLLVNKKNLPEFRNRMTELGWVMEDY